MKEVVAIIRLNKIQPTKEALAAAGYPSMTVDRVMGRGKQKGLHLTPPATLNPQHPPPGMSMKYIPKRMITMIVEDECVDEVVDIIMNSNRTGQIGDGRIFILPVEEAIRIRTAETGDEAL